ncbi:MAG: diguanylate cyclase, partial [Paracoccaceae bacterium]|nr:diguanylate cyclase [Paracoccaceae bacterium]
MAGRILIVDDVATNRIVFKVKLGAACYVPLLAADGASCLRLAKEMQPDLILLDLILPDMTGIEVLQRLRADAATAAIPVVVITADTRAEARIQALRAGADDCLTKPVEDEALLARLRNLVRGREAMADLGSGGVSMQTLGFAEAAEAFQSAGTIALVAHSTQTALRWRRDLSPLMPDRLLVMSREEALADLPATATLDAARPEADVFLIESDLADTGAGLRLMSELRSRSQTRHAAICILRPQGALANSAIAFDLGANDLVDAGVDVRELALRLSRLLRRKREGDRLRASVRDGLRLALIDPLTGLYNRRYALRQLATIAENARHTGTPFAVMVVDLDRFKDVNDHYGHPAGDAVLIEVARRMTADIRDDDMVARIGGEEFLIALPGA